MLELFLCEGLAGIPAVPPDIPPKRSQIKPGSRVRIVQKHDQPTGKLTEGVVERILTNSANHPRGIKVRLTSGEVGRVQAIWSPQ